MARWVFEYELEEHIDDFIQDRQEDGVDHVFVVTENRRDVAMLFVDEDDTVLINEAARTRLQELWPLAYRTNIKKLIPMMVKQLEGGHIFVCCVTMVDDSRLQLSKR